VGRLSPLGTTDIPESTTPSSDDNDFDDNDKCGAAGEMRFGRGTEIFGEIYPSVTSSTTNPTRLDMDRTWAP
jgi:hypothetical protein